MQERASRVYRLTAQRCGAQPQPQPQSVLTQRLLGKRAVKPRTLADSRLNGSSCPHKRQLKTS